MNLSGIGRVLIAMGLVAIVVGTLFVVGARLGLGRLPGDLSFSWGGVKVFAPLATCLVLSLLLTVVVNLLFRR